MRVPFRTSWAFRLALVLTVVLGSLALISAPGPEYTVHQKAFYADPWVVAFVRPGLTITIQSASITSDGTIKVTFKLTDPKGLPLDRLGVTTPGAVSLGFIAAYIPTGKTQYVAYTTRTVTSSITGNSAVQAANDSGGTYQLVEDGTYTYTFKTKAPSGFSAFVTHAIGIYGNRDLEEFDLGVDLADAVYNFVPNGSVAAVPRDVIKTATCNKCHQNLSAHGETGRKSMEMCILCHTPQTSDPDTGNTVDMVAMTHKIHMGEELPSVQAGTPYQIIGYGGSVHDYSNVVFPADTRNCTFCHEQDTGAAQAMAYLKPNMDACGACHDNVNFATGQNHANLPQISNNQCAYCHQPEGELEFDLSIRGAHTIPTFSRDLPGTVFNLVKVDNAAAGSKPTVTFTVRDKAGNAILPSQLSRLSLLMAGPTSDYPSYVREDPRSAAQVSADGTYIYTMQNAIPAGAKGSYAIGIEGRRDVTLLPGTTKAQTVRDAGVNKVIYFSVDNSTVEPRRTVVSIDNCNKCHSFLSLHGGNRNQIEQCILCHNPNETAPSPTGSTLPAQTVDFRIMVHKIHTGEELEADYSIGTTSFNDVRYPGDRRNCDACHVNDSQQLPLDTRLLNVKDPRGLLNPVAPTTAACTACHGTVYAASHALANTTVLGESCAACHKPGADASVDRVHAK